MGVDNRANPGGETFDIWTSRDVRRGFNLATHIDGNTFRARGEGRVLVASLGGEEQP